MKFRATALQDARLIELEPRVDDRGIFARTMCVDELAAEGLCNNYVQQNMSISRHRGTVRGMHLQRPPHSEVKLIRCLRGAILDVIVDLRRGSGSFLQHQAFELTEDNWHQLYVPESFAHGFQTLTDDVEVTYLVSARYAPGMETGIRFDDPALGIKWPLPVSVISDKDASWPLLEDMSTDRRIQTYAGRLSPSG
jgi:dTDP-4-dehydrorhamnose 3,5-epimerase